MHWEGGYVKALAVALTHILRPSLCSGNSGIQSMKE
jgi:hypothetical protein